MSESLSSVNNRTILECNHVGIQFGGLRAIDNFNITIKPATVYGLIGPNGAGKTTLFNLLTKVYEPTDGEIQIEGVSTKGKATADVCHMGVARTFQNIRLFNNMTVLDNVVAAMDYSMSYSLAEGILKLPRYRKQEADAKAKALDLLSIFDMQGEADAISSSLPYGEQRRLEIVRALATNPKLLLLDEPAAGMNPAETTELMENIGRIRDKFGIAILLIEHDMSLVMGVCDQISVLNFGQTIAQGTPAEIQSNPAVIEAYLGKKKEA